MFRHLSRLTAFIDNFLVLAENIGFLSAVYLFAYGKFTSRNLKANLKFCGREFIFRGKKDRGVLSHLFSDGYRIIPSASHKIEYIVDCGANIGVETLKFRYFNPNAHIIAVEADPVNFNVLRENFENDDKVVALNKGVWPVRTKLTLKRGVSAEATQVEPSSEHGEIEAIPISEIMSVYNLPRIDILKLDIEGAEEALFSKGIEEWIGKVNAIIFECNPDEAPNGVRRLVEALGNEEFKTYISGENIIIIKNATGWTLGRFIFFDKVKS